jgi:hypothetical protein
MEEKKESRMESSKVNHSHRPDNQLPRPHCNHMFPRIYRADSQMVPSRRGILLLPTGPFQGHCRVVP